MPAGSVFGQHYGGNLFWSQETQALLMEGWAIRNTLIGLLAGKKGKPQPQPQPPQVDWLNTANDDNDANMRRLQAWRKRQKDKETQ